MSQPLCICLITGVGNGPGAALIRRFAPSNYQSVLHTATVQL